MLYDNWLGKVAARFQRAFDEMATVHNFEYGAEYEVALAKTLQRLLPRRFGVCKGYVVGANGARAGDDIIVFDAHKFPTIRALAQDLSQKEQVPAEAVLAYIEAKHTLHLTDDEQDNQSIVKATKQVEQVKAIERESVEHHELITGVSLRGVAISHAPGTPKIRNPYYAAVWARHVQCSVPETYEAFAHCIEVLASHRHELPEAIVAGGCVALPGTMSEKGMLSPRRFISAEVGLVAIDGLPNPLGIAFAHLVWAIEWVRLGELPWPKMIGEQFSSHSMHSYDPPASGTKYETKPETPPGGGEPTDERVDS